MAVVLSTWPICSYSSESEIPVYHNARRVLTAIAPSTSPNSSSFSPLGDRVRSRLEDNIDEVSMYGMDLITLPAGWG